MTDALTHGQLKKVCFDYLFSLGSMVWNNPTGSWKPEGQPRIYYGKKGSADVHGITKRGKYIAVEVKVWPDVLDEDQEKFKGEVEKRGGVHVLVYSIYDLYAAAGEIA